MVIKRRDFQKAAAFIHEFLLKMNEDVECAELRDTLNLALLHMQKYYRALQSRSQEKSAQHTLSLSARGLSPMTPFVDAPDKFRWRWVNLDNARLPSNMSTSDSINFMMLPPMILAVKAGNISIMQELVKQVPATVNDIDGIGRSGLMYAVHCKEHKALNFLLEHGAEINLAAHDGSTALHHACHEGNDVALSLLLDHHGNMAAADVQGRAPIHWAVTTPNTECLQMLLENFVDPAFRDKDGLTPCMWACRMDNIRHFQLLCQSEYTISEPDGIERDANGRTWMHWAVRRTEPLECLQTLLTHESASYKDEEGKTVLMLAAEIGSLPAARLIIEIAGPECVHDRDYQGRNALHLATIGGHGDVVNFLLEQGADINIADHYNATPWDYARNRQLHYCQLIIMSHQRQRMMSNPTSPLPNGLGLLIHSENGVHEDFSKMSFRTRSEQSTPITPPHPPKRPRTNRMLQRRANSLTTPDQDKSHANNQNYPGRISNSAGQERRKERLAVSVNTRGAANTEFLQNRQDSMMTDDTDIMNVINDVDIGNGDDDIDNVSVGGMDVSDIEDNDQNNNADGGHRGKNQPTRAQRPVALSRPQQQQQQSHVQQRQQPRPPGGGGYGHLHPSTTAPSYTHPLEPQYNQDEGLTDITDDRQGPQPMPLNPPSQHKASYSPQAPPRPILRSQQQYLRGKGSVPSPPNTDPQRPHMIRQQQPLPPQPSRQATRQMLSASQQETTTSLQPPAGGSGDAGRMDQVVSPPLSSQSSDQISSRTQISVGVGPAGGGGGGVGDRSTDQNKYDQNRPNSGGNKPPGVLEGRRIPPPILTPLPNAPKPPMPFDILDRSNEKKKKKKKKGRGVGEKDREVKSPPQNPLEIPPPRGYAAPLHPQQGRVHSAALPPPKYSKGQPQHHDRYVDENVDEGDKPPVINGFAVPIREGTLRSARPGQRSVPMETDESAGMSTDVNDNYHAEGVKECIAEEEEADEIGMGPLISPPQAFRGASQQGGRPLAQSIPQDRAAMRMAPTSAKPPLPRGNRNSASITRRSGDKNVSPGRRPRPRTSKSSAHS